MNPYGTALLCLVLVAAVGIACCVGTQDGGLPPAVTFRGEVVHAGETSDELLVKYYPNSTAPADYTVTFEIRQEGAIKEAVAGRVYENISAERPIELPTVTAETGVPVTVGVVIYDHWGRAVHTSTVTLTPGAAEAA